jgi:hypothetical protein
MLPAFLGLLGLSAIVFMVGLISARASHGAHKVEIGAKPDKAPPPKFGPENLAGGTDFSQGVSSAQSQAAGGNFATASNSVS